MSIPYVDMGRTAQKRRTRDALVDAARALIARGLAPTVEDAAVEAAISRTTAYRYFANQHELLTAAHPHIDAKTLLPADGPSDPVERMNIVLDETLRMTLENEPALRMAFVLSLDAERRRPDELVLRRGRVIGWLEDALSPLRDCMSAKQIGRLARAIRSAAGIESLIWLIDVAGLSRQEAVKLMKWSARAMLEQAMREAR